MKKTLLVSALLGLVILSGCSWGGDTAPAETAPVVDAAAATTESK